MWGSPAHLEKYEERLCILLLLFQEKSKDASAPKMRIVAYNGDWSCECGKVNRLWDTCSCGQAGPCRDWVRGRCKYGQECR